MKQLNWLKMKDVDNERRVFIKPDFFDFTGTKYADGIPVLDGETSLEELEKILNRAELYIQDNINSLVENCREDNEKPLERLISDFGKYQEGFFVKCYSGADFEILKSYFYPRIVLPYVNHDDHIFSHGIAINGERNYEKEGIYKKYENLNSLIFEITKKHLSLI